jgi:uncharacterized protein (TIGR03492 family)
MKLLCLSNGHGEDIIATKILEQLQQQSPNINLGALPLVGEGYAYKKMNIPIIGKVKQMPSGGFIYMDSRQLLRDVKGGLLRLTLDQYGGIRQWIQEVKKTQDQGLILAVGDIVPLLFAWLSGVNYAFVGTAKSEYYLRDDAQWLDKTSAFEKWMGGVYLPWERWLMSRQSCKGVFPRDQLTTQILQNYGIRAFNFGNPMMDDLEECFNHNFNNLIDSPELNFVLLPGSRVPEVYENWQLILNAINYLLTYFSHKKLTFYGAIAKSVPLNILEELLIKNDWIANDFNLTNFSQIDGKGISFIKDNHTIFITQNAYQTCLNKGQIAISMAGTATEQFIGLGKPAITLIGKGPQFTPAFAEAQTRLLGKSIFLLEKPEEITNTVDYLINNLELQTEIKENAKKRMGLPGSAKKIAQFLLQL